MLRQNINQNRLECFRSITVKEINKIPQNKLLNDLKIHPKLIL